MQKSNGFDPGFGPRSISHSIHEQEISHLKSLPQKAKATKGKRHLKIIDLEFFPFVNGNEEF
jgi:hypothetical protein